MDEIDLRQDGQQFVGGGVPAEELVYPGAGVTERPDDPLVAVGDQIVLRRFAGDRGDCG
jgi:hypothetical protein